MFVRIHMDNNSDATTSKILYIEIPHQSFRDMESVPVVMEVSPTAQSTKEAPTNAATEQAKELRSPSD